MADESKLPESEFPHGGAGAPEPSARLAVLVRIRWAFAAGLFAYALTVAVFLGGGVRVGTLPMPVFLLALPMLVLVQNLGISRLARRPETHGLASFLSVAGDLIAVSIGLHGTGGVASWLWALFPLLTLEAVFLTRNKLPTVCSALAAVAMYAVILASERSGWLPQVVTELTRAEQARPLAYLAAKTGWVALITTATALAGLAALSAIGRAQRALEVAYARLAEQHAAMRDLDRLKDNVLSIVSHELRTPLTVAQGYAELAETDPGLSDEARHYMVETGEAIRRAAAKVDQMLAYAKLTDPACALHWEPTSAREVVEMVFRRQEATCRAAGLVVIREETEIDVIFLADAALIVDALGALVENACHATPKGGTVGIGARGAGSEIAFEVWDTGPGVPEEVRARLGEAFKQTGSVLTAHAPGLGLGLAFARLVALRHGGTLAVSERPGGGTLVQLLLRASSPAQADRGSSSAADFATGTSQDANTAVARMPATMPSAPCWARRFTHFTSASPDRGGTIQTTIFGSLYQAPEQGLMAGLIRLHVSPAARLNRGASAPE